MGPLALIGISALFWGGGGKTFKNRGLLGVPGTIAFLSRYRPEKILKIHPQAKADPDAADDLTGETPLMEVQRRV